MLIEATDLTKEFPRARAGGRLFTAVHPLDLTLDEGQLTVITGHSGSGKSMTLKCIAGLETPDRGQIILNGRTLYDLRETIARIREATKGMKGLKIGIMGCIVNGPGEMADADYGYVGAGINHVSLYRKQVCVEKNIPQEVAVEHLLALIRKDREGGV